MTLTTSGLGCRSRVDLQQHKGASIVIAGREAPPRPCPGSCDECRARQCRQDSFLHRSDRSNSVDQRQSLQELINDIDGGRVEMLVIVGGNPVYNTPADLKLDKDRMFKTKLRVHLSQYRDETSELCHWHIPETHYLEAWSDTRSYDGTVTIVQPLIEPLYQNKSAHELLAVFTPQYDQKPYEIIREYWQSRRANSKQQAAISRRQEQEQQAGQQVQQTAAAQPRQFSCQRRQLILKRGGASVFTMGLFRTLRCRQRQFRRMRTLSECRRDASDPSAASHRQRLQQAFELVFRTDPTIYDGRFANNGWLQELPKPLVETYLGQCRAD